MAETPDVQNVSAGGDTGKGLPVEIAVDSALPTEDPRWGELQSLAADVAASLVNCRGPRATYRVQFHREFTFRAAQELAEYWESLGISHLYGSPYLKAVSGSRHGYDTVDHASLNPELGTPGDLQALTAALRQRGLGQILDFVPNHMGVGTDQNAWWQDVLENGPSSRYANFFDIDWRPLKFDLRDKVLLPVLGDQFGQVLESGQLRLEFQEGTFFLICYDRRYPLSPKSYLLILGYRLDELAQRFPPDMPHVLEYQSILTAIGHLPPRSATDSAQREEREREKEVIKRRLQRLCEESRELAEWIQENVRLYNGEPGRPESYDLLDKLLQEQAYRLSYWRVAADEINYRRFFDVNELAAICMERPEVFAQSHALALRLLESGVIDGLRIDHADGLFDPTAYLWRLQEERWVQLCRRDWELARIPVDESGHPAAEGNGEWPWWEVELRREFQTRQGAGAAGFPRPLYLVVEKILEHNERLPENWPVHGTTGYDFLNDVNGLLVESGNARKLSAIYSRFVGHATEFSQLAYEAKLLILRVSMSSELQVLAHQLDRISERNRWTRDFTLHGLIQALREVIACFPVYRTYTRTGPVLDRDRRYIEQAVARAKRRNPALTVAVFDFIRRVLLLEVEAVARGETRQLQAFVGRFQQFTGPVMAKAVEDTAFYRYHRLISLNEVGCAPEQFGISLAEFHRRNQDRQAQQPEGMLATSTHDTKRSEDVRARIHVLSEIPDLWKSHLSNWTRWNKRKKVKVENELAPSRNDEYLLYQTLLGTWPLEVPRGDALERYRSRIQQYMLKAVREAKQNSSWIAPRQEYEQALQTFIDALLSESPLSAFRVDFEPFAAQVAQCGMWNSLSQTLLKLTSPGVPDIYQGSEMWEFLLVDPDNRGAVDYARRCEAVREMQGILAAGENERRDYVQSLWRNLPDGRLKLWLHVVSLQLRKSAGDLFTTGRYVPLETTGERADRVCAFVRQNSMQTVVVVVSRLTAGLLMNQSAAPLGAEFWKETAVLCPASLIGARWRNVLTGEKIAMPAAGALQLGEIFSSLPVALLQAE